MGRVTATVLFTDLVGSTELRGRLGEEAADELGRMHDRLLTEAVGAHEGGVVKGLGDGIMATFAGAADAVAAAVAIQQAVDRLNRTGKTPAPLAVRVGLSAGDVAVEDDDVHGTPVIEAARLCAEAGGGEILASEVVRWLGGTEAARSLTPVGSLELKGLAAPVPAVRVEWDPIPVSSIPLPALLTGAGRIFVGRDGELQRLGQLWKEAVAGGRRVALVAGEPGIGKTRLAAAAARAFHDEGAVVLAGRCDEDLGVPYQPFVEALRHYVLNGGSELRLGRHGGELVRLVPEVADVVAGLAVPLRSDPETERYRLFDAVAAWLGSVSAEEPVLLVLDDLQWAAKPTLLLLRHVLRHPETMSLLVVVTYRDSDVARGHPLAGFLADLRRESAVERISLTGLDPACVAAFMVRAAGHDLDESGEELARAVWRETEGSPFFVAEVFRHLAETGALEQRDGRWVVTAALDELGIPEGVRDVVGRRLSRLSEDTNRVLACASVAGLEFEPAVVETAGGFDEDIVLAALEEAVGSRLLAEVAGTVPRIRFAHALVRATLYDELTAARRVAFHRKTAEAIETLHAGALDDYLPALAHHWARASAPRAETTRAVDYATRAGDRALSQLAHDEAAVYYAQALELVSAAEGAPDGTRHLELLIALGEAQRRAADPASRETLLEAAALARARNDVENLARAALANTRALFWSSGGRVDVDRVAVLEAALTAVGVTPTSVRARLLASLALELVWTRERPRRLQLSDESLRIARQLAEAPTLAHVLMTRAYTIGAPDTLVKRQADTAELLSLAEVLADPLIEFIAHFLRARVALEAGEVHHGGSHLREAQVLARELGQPTMQWMAGWLNLGYLVLAGKLGEAERVASQVFENGQSSGQPDADFMFVLQRWVIYSEQGRLAELEPQLSELVPRFPNMPGLGVLLAATYCELSRDEEARAWFEPLVACCFDLPEDTVWLGFLTVAAGVAHHLGDRRAAAVLYDLHRPYADVFPLIAAVGTGTTVHYLGVLAATLGRFDEAEACFVRATQTVERIGAPVWLARTRLEWADMLLTRRGTRDREHARELLSQALATAREVGLATVERRAVALLEKP